MVRLELISLTILMVVNGISSQSSQDPTVDTGLGRIVGVQHTVTYLGNDYIVERYLGIPYAKPPVGNLRFRKPVAYGPFSSGTYQAKNFGNSCAQLGLDSNEDCLFLNVYVPTQAADQPSGHAVMIYIHGGGYVSGTSSIYEGDTLAAHGNVIVVTVNYRLWLFGFLNLEIPEAEGNMALWDQHMAIQWVHDNIRSFGGDTGRVIVFGQSAGSGAVSLQSLYPGNRGLISGVITESGSPFQPGGVYQNNKDRAKVMATKLQCDSSNTNAVLKCLQSSSTEQIIQALNITMMASPSEGLYLYIFLPTIDGDFIKEMPRTLLDKPNSEAVQFLRSINLISGFNSGEGGLDATLNDPSAMADDFTVSRDAMNNVFIEMAYKKNYKFDETITFNKELVPLIAHEYTDWTGPDNATLLRDQYSYMARDLHYGTSAVEYSRLHAGDGTSSTGSNFLYLFEAEFGGHVIPNPSWLNGAGHGDELVLIFGFPSQLPLLTSTYSVFQPTADKYFQLSDKMIKRWSNFAKTGDPNVPGETVWPQYTATTEEYFRINWNDSVGAYLMAREIDFWYDILPAVESEMSLSCSPVNDEDSGVSSASVTCVCSLMIALLAAIVNILF